MSRWIVLALLLCWFIVGDLIGGVVANRFDLDSGGELTIEFVLFALAAAALFPRIR